ncbi:MAG: hypothetical protein KatS3mg115_1132 [Candidatus Poribacteria bacterium]|nr:MAG: hypothetical protein KatS3mg115_1132 [Candidatus Poribacteria bacterium]
MIKMHGLWSRRALIGSVVLMLLAGWIGCAKVATTVTGGAAVAFSSARSAEDAAFREQDYNKRREKLQEAYQKYLRVIEIDPDGSFGNRARYRAARIQLRLVVPGGANYQEAQRLLNEIIQREPAGYLASLARTDLAALQRNRERIREAQRIYDNTPQDAPPDRWLQALNALYSVAQSFEELGDYDSAIQRYRRVVEEAKARSQAEGDEFYRLAAKAQFQIGNIYFYGFHNYLDGWPEFAKVIQEFPKSFEAEQARTLLIDAKEALDQIQEDWAYVQSKRKDLAVQYMEAGRRVLPTEIYGVYTEQVAQTLQQIAMAWEKPPLLWPEAAIAAYRMIIEEVWTETFVAAEAAFQIGRLYQDAGRYLDAIDAYQEMLDKFPQGFRRDEAVYNLAVCYETIREFEKAYRQYKAAMSLGEDTPFYRAAEQKVRQFEQDADGDGYPFYQEQQAGTSDKDPNSYPGAPKQTAMR